MLSLGKYFQVSQICKPLKTFLVGKEIQTTKISMTKIAPENTFWRAFEIACTCCKDINQPYSD